MFLRVPLPRTQNSKRRNGDRHDTSRPHLRYTITHLPRAPFASTVSFVLFVVFAAPVRAQNTQLQPPVDPFGEGRWHAEFIAQAALEAWNYNTSHEEIYGLVQGVTYGLRDGLVLTTRQRLYYLSQRLNDSRVLGLTGGLRARVYRHRRMTGFVQFDFGISDAAVALPPRGTRFNYLALGGGGVLARLTPRVHLIATLELIHISNASLKGPDRNPDIEAIGPSLGILIALGGP
jgi:hypothetical protein